MYIYIYVTYIYIYIYIYISLLIHLCVNFFQYVFIYLAIDLSILFIYSNLFYVLMSNDVCVFFICLTWDGKDMWNRGFQVSVCCFCFGACFSQTANTLNLDLACVLLHLYAFVTHRDFKHFLSWMLIDVCEKCSWGTNSEVQILS